MTKTRKPEWAYALFGTSIVVFICLALIGAFIYYTITDIRVVMVAWLIIGVVTFMGFITFLTLSMARLAALIAEKRSTNKTFTTSEE